MSEIKQTCNPEVKAACRALYKYIPVAPCQRETDGTVELCQNQKPMDCGHARAYLRYQYTETWCAACQGIGVQELLKPLLDALDEEADHVNL